MRAKHSQGGVVFRSPCVTVVRGDTSDDEETYTVYLWDDDCGCEDGCPEWTPALEAIGPWAPDALPISTEYDGELGATVLVVASYTKGSRRD